PFLFFYGFVARSALRSFPTRRSSDLVEQVARGDGGVLGPDGGGGGLSQRAPRRAGADHAGRELLPRDAGDDLGGVVGGRVREQEDRKSTRLNSSHVSISYAVFCLKKK